MQSLSVRLVPTGDAAQGFVDALAAEDWSSVVGYWLRGRQRGDTTNMLALIETADRAYSGSPEAPAWIDALERRGSVEAAAYFRRVYAGTSRAFAEPAPAPARVASSSSSSGDGVALAALAAGALAVAFDLV